MLGVLVLAAVWIGASTLAGLTNHQRLETTARGELRLIPVVNATLVQVAGLAALRITHVTVRVYVVKRPLALLGVRVLKCAASVTLQTRPPQRSHVLWTRGTGIVGICWDKAERERAELVAADTHEIGEAARRLSAHE